MSPRVSLTAHSSCLCCCLYFISAFASHSTWEAVKCTHCMVCSVCVCDTQHSVWQSSSFVITVWLVVHIWEKLLLVGKRKHFLLSSCKRKSITRNRTTTNCFTWNFTWFPSLREDPVRIILCALRLCILCVVELIFSQWVSFVSVVYCHFSRMILVGLSFGALYLSRKSIDNRRYDDYKARQRMKEANRGEYDTSNKYTKHQTKQTEEI